MCEKCGGHMLILDGIKGSTHVCVSCGHSMHMPIPTVNDIDPETFRKWINEMEEDLKKENGNG